MTPAGVQPEHQCIVTARLSTDAPFLLRCFEEYPTNFTSSIFPILLDDSCPQNLDHVHRPVFCPSLHQSHPLYHPQSIFDPPKNGMLPIQPRGRSQRYEELASVRIRSAICHTQNPSSSVLQRRMNLVFKLLAVDRAASSPSARWVSCLKHEVWDYAVEDDVVVVASLGEGSEVLACL